MERAGRYRGVYADTLKRSPDLQKTATIYAYAITHFVWLQKKRVYFDQNKRPRRVLMPRKGRRRRRKLAPPPEHEGKLHNKPHEAKWRPMLPFTFVRQTRAKLRLLAIFLF